MLSLVASLVLAPVAGPVNIVPNGNFSAGRKDFTSHYVPTSDLFPEGTYTVGDDPKKFHSGAFSMGDHTTGRGNMLIVNGGAFEKDTVWQAVTKKVTPNQMYEFSGWMASWSMNPHDGTASDINPGRLLIYIGGKIVGPVHKIDAKSGVWTKFSVSWKSGNQTEVTMKIVNTNELPTGNDFALDDLSLAIKPEK